MTSSTEILTNAERLISDAEYLCADGRRRSAATLIVHALEQMGEFVEVLTLEQYPNAEVRMGIFDRPNKHAKRQDAVGRACPVFCPYTILSQNPGRSLRCRTRHLR
jgi:hypothetical protein